MQEGLSLKLIERFPDFFQKNQFSMNKNRFHFETGNGWFQILYDMALELETEMVKIPLRYTEEFQFYQIKNKFGMLRPYSNLSMVKEVDSLRAIIDKAVLKSNFVCENCGCETKERNGMISLCEECKKKRWTDE